MRFTDNKGKIHIAPEKDELLVAAKDFFKVRGYLKERNRWTKKTNGFILCFYIQGSQWDKNDYYVRPGVFITDLKQESAVPYGHFATEIRCYDNTIEKILTEAEMFLEKFSNKENIKEAAKQIQKNRKEFYKKNPEIWILPEEKIIDCIINWN